MESWCVCVGVYLNRQGMVELFSFTSMVTIISFFTT